MKFFAISCLALVQTMLCFADEQSGAEMIEQSQLDSQANGKGFQRLGLTNAAVEISPTFEEQSRYPAMIDSSQRGDGSIPTDDNRQ